MNEKEERVDSPNPSQEMNSPVWQLGDSKYAQWEDRVPPFWPHWPREVTENQPYNKAGIRTTWPSLADFHMQLKQAESPSRSAERAGGSFSSPSIPVSHRTVPLQALHGQPTSWLLSPCHSVAKTLRPGEGGGVDCPQQPGSKTRRLAIQGNRSCPWHP